MEFLAINRVPVEIYKSWYFEAQSTTCTSTCKFTCWQVLRSKIQHPGKSVITTVHLSKAEQSFPISRFLWYTNKGKFRICKYFQAHPRSWVLIVMHSIFLFTHILNSVVKQSKRKLNLDLHAAGLNLVLVKKISH